jgi:acyl-CoA thioesterase I
MRTLLTVLLVAVLCRTGTAAEDAGALLPKTIALLNSGQEPVRIVCFGDSITGVYYHTGGRRAWTDMLGIALQRLYPKAKLQMINAGISGHATPQALARIQKDVLDKKPHLVVVMFGMNDVVGVPREKYIENMQSIVRRCRDAGAEVVLCTPNTIYPEDAGRPVGRLASFAAAVRDVAHDLKTPLGDCYAAYDAVKAKDHRLWAVLMSDAIHPAMNGHKLFAEEIAHTISNTRVSLADVPPPPLNIPHTAALLAGQKPVKLIAMPPYDTVVPEVITQVYPSAQVQTTVWEARGKSIAELEAWAKGIRERRPNLVVVAIPAGIKADHMEHFIRSYHWVLNWGLSYALSEWDLVVVMPSVTQAPTSTQPNEVEGLIREITLGHDIGLIDRAPGDASPAGQILLTWLKGERRAFEQAEGKGRQP